MLHITVMELLGTMDGLTDDTAINYNGESYTWYSIDMLQASAPVQSWHIKNGVIYITTKQWNESLLEWE